MKIKHFSTCFPVIGGKTFTKDLKVGDLILHNLDNVADWDNVVASNSVVITEDDGFITISADIRNNTFGMVKTLAFANDVPSTLEFEVTDGEVLNVLAYRIYKDWWTRPEFSDGLDKIPERTELVIIKTDDSCIALHAALNDTAHLQFAPSESKSVLRVNVNFTEYERSYFEGPVIYAYRADDTLAAVNGLIERLCKIYNIPMRKDREFPKDMEGLGWCSWNAFYREVTAEGLIDKCNEIKEKDIPVKWIIIDDGWQSVDKDEKMTAFEEDMVKFPEGLKGCVDKMKEIIDVHTVGVWHAFPGYWNGIKEGSKAYSEKAADLVKNPRGQWLPAADEEKAADFYGPWHKYLMESGIDLLKVDSQSTFIIHYKGCAPLAPAARNLHKALDDSAYKYMKGNLINCMGMAKEDVFSRPLSAVSRNSDDFFPLMDGSFEEHLIQNAYNSVYHGLIYHTDWDMFWTSHPQAEKHALLRAISAGPVYFSDRVGETNPEVLKKLYYKDGTVLRAPQPAIPTEDCMYVDPFKSGFLKLKNECNGVKYMAVYSYSKEACEINYSISELDPLLSQNNKDNDTEYAVFNVFSNCGIKATGAESLNISLDGGDFAFIAAAPVIDGVAVFGRCDKHLMSHAIDDIKCGGGKVSVSLKEAGEVLIYSEKKPVVTTSDENTCEINEVCAGFYKVKITENHFTIAL